ncbi:MAG: transporter substrate-binding domain-containing protein [Bacteroidales bacterium]|nr:transporter substrate-binding domain-containing protein [Bacteroidales bacterium]
MIQSHRTRFFIVFLSISLIFSSCGSDKGTSGAGDEPKPEVLSNIIEKGEIVATMGSNSIDYFIYKGRPLGYQLEMMELFAKHLGVNLEVHVTNDLSKNFQCLKSGRCDVIALDLTVTRQRSKVVDFAEPHGQTRQVLVQRKPDKWWTLSSYEIEKQLIRSPLFLAGKTIHVQSNTAYVKRLRNLQEEIGDTIYIIEDRENEEESLIAMVATGEIEYTVCDEQLALVNKTYYKNLDVSTPVSFHQNLAWAVRKGADSLKTKISEWMLQFRKTRSYAFLYNKYFKNPRSVNIVQSEYYSKNGGKISYYDEIIKKLSEQNEMDWRLMASLIYQESKFHPEVVSWAGAFGLMQLMPATAKDYGVDSLSSVEDQIEAGIKHIKLIDKQLPEEITAKEERIKFILASYNVGIGHVLDARRLAEKYDKDPNIWSDNVDYFILNKSNSKYYTDKVVYYGYCRGREPYNFVIEILDRYEHYKNVIKN